jgi:uncharacterized phage protein gp47/JayE
MTELTSAGFTRDDLATILANMQTDILAIYPDATLDASTQDGQLVGIFANAIDQIGQVVEAVYDSGSPSLAYGVTLARIVEYNGIQIINGTQSQVALQFGGNVGMDIPAGTQVKCSANNELFYTLTDAVIDATGYVLVDALAVNVGAIPAPATTLSILMFPMYGVRTVTNPSDALMGKDRETDAQLRLRRTYSTATPSQSILEGIKGAVANIPEVVQVQAYENKTDYTDANGLPPHSFSVVALGGDDQEIANTIFIREPVGSNQYGDTTVTVLDGNGLPHSVTFMRPPVKQIYITLQVTPLTGWSDDMMDAMKANIVAWAQANWLIGTPVIRSQLYIPINQTGTQFAVYKIMLGTTPAAVADVEMIVIGYNEIAEVSTNNIQVVKV